MDSLMVLTMPESTVHAPSSAGATAGPLAGPSAGRSAGRSAPDDSAAALREAIGTLRSGADVQVCPVAMPGDLDGALHRRGSRTIVVAGGDAGLHSVISALHRRNELDDAVLALIPAGPGGARSAFARGAGIPTNPVEAARVVLAGVQRRFDMLMDCRGEVVVNGASVACRSDRASRALAGLGSVPGVGALRGAARAASRGSGDGPSGGGGPVRTDALSDAGGHASPLTDTLRGGGSLGKSSLSGRSLSGGSLSELVARSLRVQVVADDEVVADLDRPVLGVQVHNCTGPNAQLAERADPCDGYADVVVSFAAQGMQRLRRMQQTLRPGDHVATEVLQLRARTVSVAGQWFSLASDGKDAGAEQRCTWQVLPERLQVLVPPAG